MPRDFLRTLVARRTTTGRDDRGDCFGSNLDHHLRLEAAGKPLAHFREAFEQRDDAFRRHADNPEILTLADRHKLMSRCDVEQTQTLILTHWGLPFRSCYAFTMPGTMTG